MNKRPLTIQQLKIAFDERGMLIDRALLSTVEDLDTAVLLTVLLWIELGTREGVEKLDLSQPWTVPRDEIESHWFTFSYEDIVEVLERAISKTRIRSALKYMIQDLDVLEARRQPGHFPAMVEYRLSFEKLAEWMVMPRPEDYTVFQRSRPPTRKFLLPIIHPKSGKPHGWYHRDAKVTRHAKHSRVEVRETDAFGDRPAKSTARIGLGRRS